MGRKKHHEAHHEEHVDETWLIPYADLLTLLLALFIVLFASAQVDQKKFDQIAQAFGMAFSSGSPAVLENYKTPPQVTTGQPSQPNVNPKDVGDAKEQAYLQETVQLLEVKKVLDKYIHDNGMAADLQTVLTEDGLLIRIKDTALFPSGSAELLPQSQRLAGSIAKMLVALKQKISISGHTDNIPINTLEFPSNWDLSAKRAVNFTKFLLAQGEISPDRLSATGHGEYRPVMTNQTDEGRAKNRRVEVLIVRGVRL